MGCLAIRNRWVAKRSPKKPNIYESSPYTARLVSITLITFGVAGCKSLLVTHLWNVPSKRLMAMADGLEGRRRWRTGPLLGLTPLHPGLLSRFMVQRKVWKTTEILGGHAICDADCNWYPSALMKINLCVISDRTAALALNDVAIVF